MPQERTTVHAVSCCACAHRFVAARLRCRALKVAWPRALCRVVHAKPLLPRAQALPCARHCRDMQVAKFSVMTNFDVVRAHCSAHLECCRADSCRDRRKPVTTENPILGKNPVATQGDPCRDLNLTQAQTLSRHKVYVVTWGQNLCRDRESLCRDPNHPSCLGTVSRHGDPNRDTEQESSVVWARYTVACRSQRLVIVL